MTTTVGRARALGLSLAPGDRRTRAPPRRRALAVVSGAVAPAGGRWRRRATATSSPIRSFSFAISAVSPALVATIWPSCAAICPSCTRCSAFSRRRSATVATSPPDQTARVLSSPGGGGGVVW